MKLSDLKKELEKYSDPIKRGAISQGYFKTGKGEYGEGDVFIGVRVPDMRLVAHKFLDLSLPDIEKLLKSKIHEHRFTALEILVEKFKRGDDKLQKQIYNFYLEHTKWINNWDLVDTSARHIVGGFLFSKNRKPIYKLAKSKNLWEKRIAIISTHYFIFRQQFDDTFKIAELLLGDSHDLIHKAVGWMLREVGNKDKRALVRFLNTHAESMPRTTLRYAIERFEQSERKAYLLK
jgi:3-methyladenine DNA glycosylase AlkD